MRRASIRSSGSPGPPGAGKSTLIASYIEARKAPGVWFQADAGDADPGTFFHYLTQAAADVVRAKPKQRAALPRFGPEYATELPSFTRRFLRAFFALFPPQSLIVIDNFHEAPANAPRGATRSARGCAKRRRASTWCSCRGCRRRRKCRD